MKNNATLKKRFLAKIKKTETCWLFTGALDRKGYGKIGAGGRGSKTLAAHRVAYELFNGKIPDGLNVLHVCDVPNCVRYDHLEVGTQQKNIQDASNRGRMRTSAHGNEPRGEAHGRAKLSASDIMEIRSLAGKKAQREIGELFGISQTQVSRIVNRAKWKHI